MAKSQVFGILAIVTLLSVRMAVALADADCYYVHPEILCVNGNTSRCSAFCKYKFGPKTTVQCVENDSIPGLFCVCNTCGIPTHV